MEARITSKRWPVSQAVRHNSDRQLGAETVIIIFVMVQNRASHYDICGESAQCWLN